MQPFRSIVIVGPEQRDTYAVIEEVKKTRPVLVIGDGVKPIPKGHITAELTEYKNMIEPSSEIFFCAHSYAFEGSNDLMVQFYNNEPDHDIASLIKGVRQITEKICVFHLLCCNSSSVKVSLPENVLLITHTSARHWVLAVTMNRILKLLLESDKGILNKIKERVQEFPETLKVHTSTEVIKCSGPKNVENIESFSNWLNDNVEDFLQKVTPLVVAAVPSTLNFQSAKVSDNQLTKYKIRELIQDAIRDKKDNVESLLAGGVRPNEIEDSALALLLLVESNEVAMMKRLLDIGVNPSGMENRSDSNFPLFMASMRGHTEAVKLLIDAGACVDASNENGVTSLFVAVQNDHIEVVKILIDATADVNQGRTTDNASPLYIAVQNDKKNMVQLLLEHGAHNNDQGPDGFTPLYMAARGDKVEIVRLLLGRGNIDVNEPVIKGFSPFFKAVQKNCLQTVELMIENGAKLDAAGPQGITPRQMAEHNGHHGILKLFSCDV